MSEKKAEYSVLENTSIGKSCVFRAPAFCSVGTFLCHKRINVLGNIKPSDQEGAFSQRVRAMKFFVSVQKDQSYSFGMNYMETLYQGGRGKEGGEIHKGRGTLQCDICIMLSSCANQVICHL